MRKATENDRITIEFLTDYLQFDDLDIWIDNDGIIHADDSTGGHWDGAELFEFLTYEALDFDENGELMQGMFVPAHILEPYKKLSAEYGIIAGR